MMPGEGDTEPLPADLARPRRDPASTQMWMGVIVGGFLLLVNIGLLIVAACIF